MLEQTHIHFPNYTTTTQKAQSSENLSFYLLTVGKILELKNQLIELLNVLYTKRCLSVVFFIRKLKKKIENYK